MITEPSAWVASASGDARQIGRKRRPRPVLDLRRVAPGVVADLQLLTAGHDHVGAAQLAPKPEPLEHEPDHPQVLGEACP